eukprot:CAMPEP_0167756790 /NCGR_PEP_ID=MMETSP0110_2-20121227/9576_1 /TAXON_ID=629695 /ORGANISM="Gymnochlora sp., Strain CCMP2014" /LENGTH=240 /DNA_ID=CAMNT_0007642929 /DNA_START=188 /DNA_END=910 /DNA_ORIENTATION=-
MSWCATYGCWLWANRASEIKDRVYGYQYGACLLAEFNCAFQGYDLAVSIVVKTLRKADRLAHHTITTILAFWCYHYHLLLYYGIFFFGVSEVSSMFLAFVEFFKEFPKLRDLSLNPCLHQFNELTRMIFAGLFLSFRVVYWPYVSMQFWADSIDTLGGENPALIVELIFTLMANIGLTLLQFFWGTLILKQIHKKLFSQRKFVRATDAPGNDCEYGAISNGDEMSATKLSFTEKKGNLNG